MAHRNDSIAIDPYGNLFKCEHDAGNEHFSTGNVFDGLNEHND